jgi:AcrR family transcriptional regulator
MAKVNLERRAEIGQEKRARTRAQLLAAASALFAKRSWASVTIDDLVREAGVAKGTFYVHFEDMHALTVAVADELIHSFDEMIQLRRASTSDPLLRVALGCDAFIERALEDPAWGALVARMARSNPSVGERTRRRLKEDLARVLDNLPGGGLSVDLALEAAIGVVLQVLAAIGEGRLKGAVAQPALGAVLGAIGIGKQQAATTLAKLKRAKAAPIERAPAA